MRATITCSFVSATESCNNKDDNCNGQVDENVMVPSPVQVCGVSASALSSDVFIDAS